MQSTDSTFAKKVQGTWCSESVDSDGKDLQIQLFAKGKGNAGRLIKITEMEALSRRLSVGAVSPGSAVFLKKVGVSPLRFWNNFFPLLNFQIGHISEHG